MSGLTDELGREQSTLDDLYARLDELRAQARARLRRVRKAGPSGSPQNRSERDAFATLYEDRLAQLEAVEDRLCFGRLDLADGATRYIGRLGLTDAEHTSLLTDWRAPAAQAFYRATAAHADDVVRRRHLVTRGRQVVSLEDEVLDLDAYAASDDQGAHLSGEGALLAAMAAKRTGRMNDIVATIQSEQDEIIRAPLTGALVVQGGPGTGKTAVALHRAAYLLYNHRKVLERSGVLLVGPSPAFLRYIDQVLPSLGETGVVSSTLGGLLPGVRATQDDEGPVARLKGDLRMAKAVERAVRARQRVPERETHLRVDGVDVVIRPRDVADAMSRARRSHKPHNEARAVFVRDMLGKLATQVTDALAYAPEDRSGIVEDLRSTREVRVALNIAWFPITPEQLVRDLFTKPHRLAQAAPHLTEAERALLARPADAPWTIADIPLLDEAAELLGEDDELERVRNRAAAAERARDREYAQQVLATSGAGAFVDADTLVDRFAQQGPALTTAERAAADRAWTYGHVVVDEAQELSPMAWRMLLRRCPTRSLTIVGDVAQTANAAGATRWETMLRPLLRDGWQQRELTVNYRTPDVLAQGAQDVALAAGLPVSPVTSAREVDDALRVVRVEVPEVVTATVAEAVAAATETVGADRTGRVAVVTLDPEPVRVALRASAVARLLPDGSDVDAPLAVLVPHETKGLEFDVVVLVEPATLRAPDLYVAMTRATRQLRVVTSGALPAGWPHGR
ncbi:DNA helicase [Flavimobilis marinus]|uniref:DNA helicase IV n=1 Tax=Flavimobilis marinus TaxID=285351 RepID=A0A1I2E970_9MICO|nr:ATP-binding domain-containing protein [Flavimobilis marinus]GHG43433.1 DNA helicase [Flavimobilis marinus]SFE89146.1 DNA helicase IV [Flavimobilis marinus]